jgi:hypothetical protein
LNVQPILSGTIEMTSEKIKAVFDYLCDELDRGNHFFQIFKSLEEAYTDERIISSPYFFAGVYDACLREAILSLAKLLVPDKESINIYYLLSIASQNPEVFPFIESNKVKDTVNKHQRLLEDLQIFIEELKGQRDQVVAHLDRKHINNPSKMLSNQINLTELEKSFDVLLQLVNTYMRYYDNRSFSFGIMESSVKQELDYILSLMEKEYR